MTRILLAIVFSTLVSGCTSGTASTTIAVSAATPQSPIKRPAFLGAFFRPQGAPPFGVFSVFSKQIAPAPYPTESTTLFGSTGYCDKIAASGTSISSGYLVDSKKLGNIVDLGVRWTRTPLSAFFSDLSHLNAPGPDSYAFGQLDSAQCALARHHIEPVIGLEAGPVQYNANPEWYAPKTIPTYKTAADFGQWCSVIAKHELHTFTTVHRYSLPGNEVNSNPELFPGGDAQIARYSRACYSAIKRVQPKTVIYGFELNADRSAEPAAFIKRMYDLGCKAGTCYDAISIHMSLRYPIPPATTPCYPNAGGNYDTQCLTDLRTAAHGNIHLLIGETGYFVPGNVPDEVTKARAISEELHVFAEDPAIDGVNYANIDECDLYPTGYFMGGCVVDSLGTRLPGFAAMKSAAGAGY
jgi:hypothetical protein